MWLVGGGFAFGVAFNASLRLKPVRRVGSIGMGGRRRAGKRRAGSLGWEGSDGLAVWSTMGPASGRVPAAAMGARVAGSITREGMATATDMETVGTGCQHSKATAAAATAAADIRAEATAVAATGAAGAIEAKAEGRR